MKKILITGGSGFIGTNLIEHLLKKTDAELLTFDINEPKIDSHNRFWKRVDIREYEELREKIVEYKPDIVIHLAARTDLRGLTLKDYDANMTGVSNLLKAIDEAGTVQRQCLLHQCMCVNPDTCLKILKTMRLIHFMEKVKLKQKEE